MPSCTARRSHPVAALLLAAIALAAGCSDALDGSDTSLRVLVTQSADGTSSVQAATYQHLPAGGEQLGEVLETHGPCALYGWFPDSGLPPERIAPVDPRGDAGQIRVTTASSALVLDWQETPERGYRAVSRDAEEGPLWLAGEPLTVTATGGADHAAFALDLVAPQAIEPTSLPMIDATAPWTLAWAPPDSLEPHDTVELTLWRTQVDPLGRLLTLHCSLPESAAAARVTLGTDTLAAFAAGALPDEIVHIWLSRRRFGMAERVQVVLEAWAEPRRVTLR